MEVGGCRAVEELKLIDTRVWKKCNQNKYFKLTPSSVRCIFDVMYMHFWYAMQRHFGGASLVRLLLCNASLVQCLLDPRGIFGQIWILGARQTSSAQCCHYKKVSFGCPRLMGIKSLADALKKCKILSSWDCPEAIYDTTHKNVSRGY